MGCSNWLACLAVIDEDIRDRANRPDEANFRKAEDVRAASSIRVQIRPERV